LAQRVAARSRACWISSCCKRAWAASKLGRNAQHARGGAGVTARRLRADYLPLPAVQLEPVSRCEGCRAGEARIVGSAVRVLEGDE
jgi:hypothetical protein